MCKGIIINLGSCVVTVDTMVLELGGLDVVLGVFWLSTLGQVVMNWKTLTIQFWHEQRSGAARTKGIT